MERHHREDRVRGESRLEEQALRSLGNQTVEQKLNLLLKKYIELEKDNKRLGIIIKQQEKHCEVILREKDNLQKEYNKGVLIKDKLEQVCREQQKLIKSVKNENLSKIREEEEHRKENLLKFQHSINEINQTLGKNNDENNKLRDDNIEMSKKLKYFAEQYHSSEKQLEKINEHINLESQLHEAKLSKIQMEAAIEKETVLRDKQEVLDELLSCKKSMQEMHSREVALKEQLHLYTSKYDDFQSSLQKSNTIFSTYKVELEKLAKNAKKLEKENNEWRRKWEKSNAGLIELATEKQAKDEYVAKCARQVQQLQKLLRALQAERNVLHQVLKDNNIERPPMPVAPAEPEPIALPPPPTVQKEKMDIMQKNCAELKQTLAKLQGQMNAITAKQVEVEKSTDKEVVAGGGPAPASATVTKKKNKNKKNKNKTCPTKNADNGPAAAAAAAIAVAATEKPKGTELIKNASESDKQEQQVPKEEEAPKPKTQDASVDVPVKIESPEKSTESAEAADKASSDEKDVEADSAAGKPSSGASTQTPIETIINLDEEVAPMQVIKSIEALVAAVLLKKNLTGISIGLVPDDSDTESDSDEIHTCDLKDQPEDDPVMMALELAKRLNDNYSSNDEYVVIDELDTGDEE